MCPLFMSEIQMPFGENYHESVDCEVKLLPGIERYPATV